MCKKNEQSDVFPLLRLQSYINLLVLRFYNRDTFIFNIVRAAKYLEHMYNKAKSKKQQIQNK